MARANSITVARGARDMETELLLASEPDDMRRAADLLRRGRIVAFPTETVYGLAARADDAEAVEALRRLKGRPAGKEFTLLIASPADAGTYATLGRAAGLLAERFWPGPLTLVVPARRGGEVGLRCPDCGAARELVRLTAAPLAAPSANLSGEPPALTPAEVLRNFGGRIAAVLDGGPAVLGASSTVVRARGDAVEILRQGALAEADVRAALRR